MSFIKWYPNPHESTIKSFTLSLWGITIQDLALRPGAICLPPIGKNEILFCGHNFSPFFICPFKTLCPNMKTKNVLFYLKKKLWNSFPIRKQQLCLANFIEPQKMVLFFGFFWGICPRPGLLPVLGPCERYMTPTLDVALLISSRAGTDPGLSSVIDS